MRHLPILPETLPCVPCPHKSICCSYGTDLTLEEATAIFERFGASALVEDKDASEWRTAVVNGHCYFLTESGCSIHSEPFYPRVCQGFPWKGFDNEWKEEPFYDGDISICPELKSK